MWRLFWHRIPSGTLPGRKEAHQGHEKVSSGKGICAPYVFDALLGMPNAQIDTPLERFWGSQWGPRAPKGLHLEGFGMLFGDLGRTYDTLASRGRGLEGLWGRAIRTWFFMDYQGGPRNPADA